MKLAWNEADEAFRDELVAFLDANTPEEMAKGFDFQGDAELDGERELVPQFMRDWQATLFDNGWMVPGLSARARRPELHAGTNPDLSRDAGQAPAAAVESLPRLRDRRAEPARVRQRRTEAARAVGDSRRHDLVHRHERTERRLRSCGAANARRTARRPLRRQRPEGLDELRVDCAEVLLLRAHRPDVAEAQRHLAADHRDGHAGNRDSTAASHQRHRRLRGSVLHRRRRAAREHRRPAQRRLDDHARFARPRTRRLVGRGRRPLRADDRRARRSSPKTTAGPTIRSCGARSPRRTRTRRRCAPLATRVSRRSRRVPARPSTAT